MHLPGCAGRSDLLISTGEYPLPRHARQAAALTDPQDPTAQDAPRPRRQVAVALKHDKDLPGLPRIVASGHGALAEKILSLAFETGVKVREDAELAEILAVLDVESEIPLEAISAVAEILAYVYRANGLWRPGEPWPPPGFHDGASGMPA